MSESAPPGKPSFDLSAGNLCLDLANTVSDRGGAGEADLLACYSDLLAWGRQAGAVGEDLASELAGRGARHPHHAANVLRQALSVREAVFRIFAATAAGEPLDGEDLSLLNRSLARALAQLRVAPRPSGPSWEWEHAADDLDRVMWPVVQAAADLLTGDDLGCVRECASESCRWLFLDCSRNRSRRWCDMSVCGNRDKARRHYAARKKRPATSP